MGTATKVKKGQVLNYSYTGGVQSITLPPGSYKLECWGAQGGYRLNDISTYGGKGGYSVGELTLNEETTLYVQVGGSGNTGVYNGGYNGGGKRKTYNGGGGGTDIRIGQDSLFARVIVAGGGGSDGANNKQGMYGGGESGGSSTENYGTGGGGGTQTAGGEGGSGSNNNDAARGIFCLAKKIRKSTHRFYSLRFFGFADTDPTGLPQSHTDNSRKAISPREGSGAPD